MKHLFPLTPCLFLILIFALISSPIHGQQRWDKATIVLKSNDTIQGEIAVKRKSKIFEAITVKDKEGINRTYTPLTVRSFIIHGDQNMYFKTLYPQIDFSEVALDKLSDSKELKLEKDTVFAQLLVQGSNNLYYYDDRRLIKPHYLIEKPDGTLIELINKQYYIDEHRNRITANTTYKKTLQELYPNLKSTIAQLPFKRSALVDFIKSTDVSESATRYAYQWEKPHYQIGLVSGVSINFIKLYSETAVINQLKFNPSNKINGGIMLNIILPETQKNWSIYTELLYSSFHFETVGGYEQYENENWYNKLANTTVASQHVKLVTAFRFQQVQRIAPFFQLGIGNGYSFKSSLITTYEHRFFSSWSMERISRKTRKFEQSVFLGTGISHKNFGFEARYEIGNGLAQTNYIRTLNSYLYLLISYHL